MATDYSYKPKIQPSQPTRLVRIWARANVQNPVDIPVYWLFNRDPYNGLLQSPYNWVV